MGCTFALCCFPASVGVEDGGGERLVDKSWSLGILRVSGVGDFTLEGPGEGRVCGIFIPTIKQSSNPFPSSTIKQ